MFRKRNPEPAPIMYNPADPHGVFPPIGTTLPSPYYQPSRPAPMPVIKPRRSGSKVWFKRIFITLLVAGLAAGVYVGGTFLINASRAFDGNLFGLLQNDKLEGEDVGRVNILVAGNSSDDVGHSGAELTDSIMIVSIDTENKRAFTMSVPRDLWVEIPGNGHSRINEVYQDGEEDGFSEPGYAEGGMGLLQKVIGQNFGLEFHYYALVNYTAFREAVNAVGGIDVNIQSDDPRGLYDPNRDWTKPRYAPLVKLPNGPNHLDGQEALNLARARGSAAGSYGYAQSDYTRTAHQRLMLVALKDKASSAGVALNPVRIASLLDSFGNNVKTDFETREVRRLFDLSKEIPNDKIASVGLNDVDGESLLTACRYSCRGQSALVPAAGLDDYSEVRAYIEKLLTPPPAPAQNTQQ
ncbi:MAG TPA: LCP family protein [Candidatus Saccharimonadales bacterium]|nr:LCP family protein [Candidatus Saccharimonadales bacterium]